MNDFFNWQDSWILVSHNWIWLLIAFVFGAVIGWRTSGTSVSNG